MSVSKTLSYLHNSQVQLMIKLNNTHPLLIHIHVLMIMHKKTDTWSPQSQLSWQFRKKRKVKRKFIWVGPMIGVILTVKSLKLQLKISIWKKTLTTQSKWWSPWENPLIICCREIRIALWYFIFCHLGLHRNPEQMIWFKTFLHW